MGSSNSSYLSNAAIFHFYDYATKSRVYFSPSLKITQGGKFGHFPMIFFHGISRGLLYMPGMLLTALARPGDSSSEV